MTITITPLGAGQDVGRSCILAKVGSKTIMFDCGMHMGFKDERKYPDFKFISATLDPHIINSCIDLVIISHYHLDHCGSLPFFTEKVGYSGPIIMTYPTRSISSVLLSDCCKIMEQRLLLQKASSDVASQTNASTPNIEYGYFTISDVWSCMEKVRTVQLYQTILISGIKVTPYYAGHVLGASIFHIEVDDESIVYTGDFNMVRDRHLGPAKLPRLFPSLLISESTYATYVRPSRRSTERTFCEMVHSCLKRGGKVLIPVFAIGRAQELCILLEIYWRRMKLRFPIFFGGSMTEKANSYYQLFTNWTNTSPADNIFSFPHVMPYDKSILTLPGPAVLFATPGMLHTGLSLQAFKLWAPDSNNLTIIPGFCVAGTIGSKIINGAKRVFLDQRDPSTCIEVRCNVKYLSFSSHADTIGIQNLISHSEPRYIAFVHGERQGMLKLSSFVNSEFRIPSFCPNNGSITAVPTRAKFKYLCYLSVKHMLMHILELQSLTFSDLISRGIANTDQLSNYLTNSFENMELPISLIHTLILEYLSSMAFQVYVFTLKYIDRSYKLIFTKSELNIYIRRKCRFAQKNMLGISFKLSNKLNNEQLQLKTSFSVSNFDLNFCSVILHVDTLKLLIAIQNLREKIILRQLVKNDNKRLMKFNGLREISKKLLKVYSCSDSITISYLSLIVNIVAERSQLEIIHQFFSVVISGNSNMDLEKKKIDKISISWSYIDHKTDEISEFINFLET
ncbi:CPSF metallobeta-lactamase [Cryptosporidium canis]|uniref:CPSF metallobeta-lactamase n=1 Tax=Cryptosporidium canis TaxID=195482 RepID=A0ABQ8P7N5_9CRYT|nr:CPSF metallobeta-lactamase [Cryptosporidium canis]KAJ1613922.1 CPSF metallobeta-lactamase [Cryptosporidium canis]